MERRTLVEYQLANLRIQEVDLLGRPVEQAPYVVNVSSVQDFMQCRFRWLCKWVINRVPRDESAALSQGKLLHLIFEDHLTGKRPMKEAIRFRRNEWLDTPTDEKGRATAAKAVEGIDDLAEALVQWEDQYVWEVPVLEVEEAFELPFRTDDPFVPGMPDIIIRGRPDRVGIMGGQMWHVQNRGLAGSMNFGVYMELATRHYHEHVYARALQRKYQVPYGGTLFNLVRKLKYRTNVGKKNEKVKTLDQMFFQHPMSIDLTSELHLHVMDSLAYHIAEMWRVEQEYRLIGSVPAANEKMNGGFNGATIDPYFRVLTGKIDLMDDTYFKEREDTYAATEGDADDGSA